MPPPEAKSFMVHNSPSIDFKLCLVQKYSNAKQGQTNPEKIDLECKKDAILLIFTGKKKVFYDLE